MLTPLNTKVFFRFFGSFFKDVLFLDRAKISQRIKTFTSKASDPYDNYQYIINIATVEIYSRFIFLLGDYRKNDKNISHKHPALIRLVKEMSKNGEVGIHPSF